MDGDGAQRSREQTFDNLATSEKVELIHSQVIVTLLEHRPNDVEPNSYSAAKDFLQTTMDSACEKLFEHHKPLPGLISDSAMKLLTFISAYKLVGKAVPPSWTDLCQNELESLDEKRTREDFSKDYDLFFHEQMRKQALSSQAVLETFINETDTRKTEDCDSRKRRRSEALGEENLQHPEERVVNPNASGPQLRRKPELGSQFKNRPEGETVPISFEVWGNIDTSELQRISEDLTRKACREAWRRIGQKAPRNSWFCVRCLLDTNRTTTICTLMFHNSYVKFVDGEDGQVQNILGGGPWRLNR